MKRLTVPSTLLFTVLFMQATGVTTEEGGLLFSCLENEQSNQSWDHVPPLNAINEVRRNEVQYVVPKETVKPPFDFVSWQFATKLGYNMLVGAHGGAPTYAYDADIFGQIDALMHPRLKEEQKEGRKILPLNMRQLFFSPSHEVVNSVGILRPCDVGRILPAGVFELFISAEQVKYAFGIDLAENVNLDAIALHYSPGDPNWAVQDQGIYLSFEQQESINIIEWAH